MRLVPDHASDSLCVAARKRSSVHARCCPGHLVNNDLMWMGVLQHPPRSLLYRRAVWPALGYTDIRGPIR
jgi:hypothetical protein